ncbi:ABC transporter permease [Anaerosinus massiliensis]|uniref:ABC transporter permease n=1 Tax=Massilibacillus massiliensis TaxID=1806837 RepID=UPI000AA5DE5E|nr:ABC transporter permease [Massilibacillus massiliensis]
MNENVWTEIINYFGSNTISYLVLVKGHISISFLALMIASIVGVFCGYICDKYRKCEKIMIPIFQVLRIIPSLAILVMLLPVLGVGFKSAMCALVLLAVPPILMNTVAGLREVPDFILETAYGMGMTKWQVLFKVRFPLAMPLLLTGIKTAMVEIIASATLASKIGAGGLGDIIFTGLGLFKIELLLIGGVSVAVLSIAAGTVLDMIDKLWGKYKYAGR